MTPHIGPVDAFQRRHPVISFPIAVVYKYFDDHGPYLAAILTYYAFIAIFPILLISSSILGFFLQDESEDRRAEQQQREDRDERVVGDDRR